MIPLPTKPGYSFAIHCTCADDLQIVRHSAIKQVGMWLPPGMSIAGLYIACGLIVTNVEADWPSKHITVFFDSQESPYAVAMLQKSTRPFFAPMYELANPMVFNDDRWQAGLPLHPFYALMQPVTCQGTQT